MKARLSSSLRHIVPCLAYIGLIYVFTPENLWDWNNLVHNPHELSNLLLYGLMLLAFYANYYIFTPRLYLTAQYAWFGVVLLSNFVVLYWVANHIDWPHTHSFSAETAHLPPHLRAWREGSPPPPPLGGFHEGMGKFDLGKSLILYLLGVLFTTHFRSKQYEQALFQDKIDAELRFLKAQINPHFLFNSLNSIYALTLEEGSLVASDAVTKLSSMMRYIMAHTTQSQVDLVQEIAYIENYIALQKLRFDNTVQVSFSVEGVKPWQQIAPMLLIPFIENAFKYGVNPERPSPIQIQIVVQSDETLRLVVQNRIQPYTPHKYEKNGLGLSNTQQRLALLYPQKHTLSIQQTDFFTVILQLNLSYNDTTQRYSPR